MTSVLRYTDHSLMKWASFDKLDPDPQETVESAISWRLLNNQDFIDSNFHNRSLGDNLFIGSTTIWWLRTLDMFLSYKSKLFDRKLRKSDSVSANYTKQTSLIIIGIFFSLKSPICIHNMYTHNTYTLCVHVHGIAVLLYKINEKVVLGLLQCHQNVMMGGTIQSNTARQQIRAEHKLTAKE